MSTISQTEISHKCANCGDRESLYFDRKEKEFFCNKACKIKFNNIHFLSQIRTKIKLGYGFRAIEMIDEQIKELQEYEEC